MKYMPRVYSSHVSVPAADNLVRDRFTIERPGSNSKLNLSKFTSCSHHRHDLKGT